MVIAVHSMRMGHSALPLIDTNLRYAATSNAPRGLVMGATAAAVAPSTIKPMNEQAWSNRVGEEYNQIFQSAAQATLRAGRAREMRSRSQRLGLVDPGHLADKASQLWGSDGANRLETLARQAAFRLTTGGVSALQASMHSRDPLERHLLYSKMAELLGEDDAAAQKGLEQSVLQLKHHHGDELLALSNTAETFSTLHDTQIHKEGDASAAEGLRRIYLDAGRMPGDSVITPLNLARGLLEKVEHSSFETALKKLGEGVLADLRSPQPSRHAERVGVALTNAGAFMTVRMALGISKDLRVRLSSQGTKLRQSDAQIACKLLESAEEGCASMVDLGGSIFGQDQAPAAMANANVLTSLRQAVTSMPTTWWAKDQEGARFQLLEDIDQRMSILKDPANDPAEQIAIRLRAQLSDSSLTPETQR